MCKKNEEEEYPSPRTEERETVLNLNLSVFAAAVRRRPPPVLLPFFPPFPL